MRFPRIIPARRAHPGVMIVLALLAISTQLAWPIALQLHERTDHQASSSEQSGRHDERHCPVCQHLLQARLTGLIPVVSSIHLELVELGDAPVRHSLPRTLQRHLPEAARAPPLV